MPLRGSSLLIPISGGVSKERLVLNMPDDIPKQGAALLPPPCNILTTDGRVVNQEQVMPVTSIDLAKDVDIALGSLLLRAVAFTY